MDNDKIVRVLMYNGRVLFIFVLDVTQTHAADTDSRIKKRRIKKKFVSLLSIFIENISHPPLMRN